MVPRKRKRTAVYTTPDKKCKKQKDTKIFVQALPILGEVPMLFYIPSCKESDNLKLQIEKYGGKVVDQYEAYVYQIKSKQQKRKGPKTFHRGYVYDEKWIRDSIKKGYLIDDIDEYFCGFQKKSDLFTIPKGTRRLYTITEVLRLWEFVEDEKLKDNPPMKFFNKLQTENLIPDRSAYSLRTAWKKFSKMTKSKFVKGILKKKGTRYSHNFAEVPEVTSGKSSEESKEESYSKNLSNFFNSASTKPQDELSTPSTPMVDLDVMTKEPSFIDRNGDDMEFILEVEDMQSVVSVATNNPSYSLTSRKARPKKSLLTDMYSEFALKDGVKRFKVTETENEGKTHFF
jgi:hypothetical protein